MQLKQVVSLSTLLLSLCFFGCGGSSSSSSGGGGKTTSVYIAGATDGNAITSPTY
jgi:hypothetical protein